LGKVVEKLPYPLPEEAHKQRSGLRTQHPALPIRTQHFPAARRPARDSAECRARDDWPDRSRKRRM